MILHILNLLVQARSETELLKAYKEGFDVLEKEAVNFDPGGKVLV